MSQILCVLCNVPDRALARDIARRLVEQRLAACVNIGAPVESVYRWEGRIESATETPILIKTDAARYADLERELLALHPYDVPEIIAVPVIVGSPAYTGWVEAETRA